MVFVLFAVLAAGTVLVRLTLLKPAEPPTAAGAALMGVGIFALGALQRIPYGAGLPTQLFAIETLIIWLYIASALVASYLRGTFRVHIDDTIGCFAIGTWIAGTAVLARLVYAAFPEWQLLAIILGIIAVLISIVYLPLILVRLRRIIADPAALPVTGRILLTTVSLQSLVVAADILVPGGIPDWLALAVISMGFALYVLGLALIILSYRGRKNWQLSTDWDNTNCILHGAMSITGLAAVLSGVAPISIVVACWVWAAAVLVIVEGIEIARMWVRIRSFGVRGGILVYNVSQWARNFTFGMFYLFTVRMYAEIQATGTPDLPLLNGLQRAVIEWGQYVALFFLLAEVTLFLYDNALQRFAAQAPENESPILTRKL